MLLTYYVQPARRERVLFPSGRQRVGYNYLQFIKEAREKWKHRSQIKDGND
jgi:hypothetical protein